MAGDNGRPGGRTYDNMRDEEKTMSDSVHCPFCQDKASEIAYQMMLVKQNHATLTYIRSVALSEGWWSQNMEQLYIAAVHPVSELGSG